MPQTTELELADSLRRVHEAVQCRLAAAVGRMGHSLEEWWVLADLAARPGRPMSDVSSRLLLPAPSLTKLVDRMVDQNWVHRRGDPADRRRVLLFPTARGLDRHAELRAVVVAEEAELAELVGGDALDALRVSLASVTARL